jgi:molybdopterin/thiamine biosynthesis adenylyltransferase
VSYGLHRSRTAATVAALASGKEHRFTSKRVLLTGDREALLTANGADMARDALQLLMRISHNVDIALPPLTGSLRSDLARDGERFAWDTAPRFLAYNGDWTGYDAILSIGSTVRADLPWSAITASGWIASVTSGARGIADDCMRTNPITALAAASLGVCEIFKRLVDLRPELGELLDGAALSLWDHSLGGVDGPDIPVQLDAALMLNGAGAIGSAIAHLLARLPHVGELTVVDKQDYGEENWGTCLDLERSQVGQPKAEVIARRLRPGGSVQSLRSTIKAATQSHLGTAAVWPEIVLNGLDGIDARHEAQDIWPDLVIDGALDADLQVRVSAHQWSSDRACLRCLYQHPPGEPAVVEQMRVTGLSRASLQNLDRPLTEEDVAAADPTRQADLRSRLGKPVCSIVSEDKARAMSRSQQEEGFSPSVPFAASFSASLVVTELVRYLVTGQVGVRPLWQVSMLVGPETAQSIADKRHAGCLCGERQLIDQVRRARIT